MRGVRACVCPPPLKLTPPFRSLSEGAVERSETEGVFYSFTPSVKTCGFATSLLEGGKRFLCKLTVKVYEKL